MSARRDVAWDLLDTERPDALVDRKRRAEASVDAAAHRVGRLMRGEARELGDPDWKLRLVMLREKREDEAYERRSRALSTLENRAKRSAVTKRNWAEGKYASRQQWCRHRSPERVARAKRLKSEGWTIAEIAKQLGCSAYTIAQWLGWKRGAASTKAPRPVVFQGVQYRSLSAAERDTGVSRHTIKRRTAAG